MKKRIFLLCLCAFLLATLCGCGKKSDDPAAHLEELGEQIGYKNGYSELTVTAERTFEDASIVRLQQNYQGFPVYGRTAVYIRDENGDLMAVNGNVLDVDESLSLQPSLVLGDAIHAAKGYLDDPQAQVHGELQIYIQEEESTSHLVYVLHSDVGEVLVDAHSGEVLHYASSIWDNASSEETVTGTLYGQEWHYPNMTYVKNENWFVLMDPERKITCFEAINGDVNYKNGSFVNVDYVQWQSGNCDNKVAVDAYSNMVLSYDYFASVLKHIATDGNGAFSINIAVDATTLNGESIENGNALSCTEAQYATTSIVYSFVEEAGDVDIAGHEYAHGVSRCIADLQSSGESGAISEGISDIYGELIQHWCKGDSADWVLHTRNLKDPEQSSNPSSYKDENWYPEGGDDGVFVHTNSTVISHAAYLMTQAGGGTLNYEELANLLYRTMCLIPSDCDFMKFRECVEWAALSMSNLTAEDRVCISEAFDLVNIGKSMHVLDVGGSLAVLDRNDEPYDDYEVTVWKLNSPFFFPILRLHSTDMELVENVQVTSDAPFIMDYKAGYYYLELVDNKDPTKQVGVKLMLWEDAEPEVEVTTNFGLVTITGEVMGMGDMLREAEVTLTCGGETFRTITDEEGKYSFLIPDSNHSLELTYTKDGFAEKSVDVVLNDDDFWQKEIKLELVTLTHAYAEVIHQRNEEYGTTDFYEISGGYQIIKGVFYIDLLDFDADGSDELVICYGAGRSYDAHYIEVWTMADGVPVMVHQGTAMHGSDISQYFLLNEQDGKWYVGSGWYGYEADISFYGLADGKMYQTVSFAYSVNEDNGDTNCTAGGKSITWAEFQAYTSLWYDNSEYISCLYIVGNMSESPISWRRHMELTEHTSGICERLGMNLDL